MPAPLLLSLIMRKVVLVPVAVISLGAAGMCYGAFELTTTLGHLLVGPPPKQRQRPVSRITAGLAAVTTAAAVTVVRETIFRPIVPPAPAIDIGFTPQGLRRLYAAALHTVYHYPYAHRGRTCVLAGVLAGLAHVSMEVLMKVGAESKAPASDWGLQQQQLQQRQQSRAPPDTTAAPEQPDEADSDASRDASIDFGASTEEQDRVARVSDDSAFSVDDSRVGRVEQRRRTLRDSREQRAEARVSAADHAADTEEAEAGPTSSGVAYESDPYSDGRLAKVKTL